jgi:flagellar motor switch protein FliG
MSGAAQAQLPAGRQAPTIDLSGLRGPQKAAVLLVALGEERAGEVFRHLPPTEVEALSLEIAKSRKVAPEMARAVVHEAVETVMADSFMAEGGVDYAKSVLERSLGAERAAEIVGRLSATMERRPFEFLRRTPPEQIGVFLRHESPQTIALIVANLHTALAAQVLDQLPPEEQVDVARRVATMSETRPDVVSIVETVMQQKLSNVIAQEYAAVGGVESLAEILNAADRPTERNVLDQLATANAELAEQIRLLLFTFEDIVKLDDRAIQLILKEVDSKDLAVALRGVGKDVQERIFSNMSERGGEMLAEEMEYMPAQKRVVVEEAQGRIVASIRKLEESGEIVISRGNSDEDQML